MQSQSIVVSQQLKSSYLLSGKICSQNLLLLHGYEQTASTYYEQLQSILTLDTYNIIIPNGLYPLPTREKDKYEMNYAWYFYDHIKDHFVVPMDNANNYLKNILEKEQILNLPTTVIGYSQGGFLATQLKKAIPSIQKIIAISCHFRKRIVTLPAEINIAINGTDDKMICANEAQEYFNDFINQDHRSKFYQVEGMGHKLNKEGLKLVQKSLLE